MKSVSIEKNRRILVVDDNASIHDDFWKILARDNTEEDDLARANAELFGQPVAVPGKGPGFEVVAAFQGQDGLAAVREAAQSGRPFAMAFVDVRMPPGWDGIETTARLWEADPDLQIVICTAYSDYSWDEMTARLGVSDRMVILKKPFDVVEVLQLANTLTAKWTLLQQVKLKFQDLERVIGERTHELEASNEQLRGEVRERELTEQVLRGVQEKLNHFLAKSPAVLYSFRIESGKPVPSWVSDNFTHFTGHEVQDWYRQAPGLEYVEETDRVLVRDSLTILLAQGHLSLPYRVRRKDGTLRWVRDDRQLLRDEQGQPIEIVGCWTDTTEQRLLEGELRQSQKMESVGLLAGGIAHDFNNLLTVIRCHVELLLSAESFSNPTADVLRNVLDAADRSANLTRQLLAFSRKQVIRAENLDANELISALTKLLARTLGDHITVIPNYAPNLPAVLADPGMIEQVIMNLAVNARDAMPKGGQLTLSTSVCDISDGHKQQNPESRRGRHVCLSVADTGSGIAPEHQTRVFEPFFTTKEAGKGTGLGLATVYGIVKQHEGWIELESQVGRGTTFKIFLPVSSKKADKTITRIPEPLARGGHETILVVEDEPALLALVCKTLQRQGYRVFTAGSGAEAFNNWSARLHQIDLLLTDLVMPAGLTGWELANKLQAQKPGLKAMYMSGYSTDMNGHDPGVRQGVHLLTKPFGLRTLANAVRGCLDEKQQNDTQNATRANDHRDTNLGEGSFVALGMTSRRAARVL